MADTGADRARHEIAIGKSEVYRQLGRRLTYHPGRQLVRGVIDLKATGHWF
jgi:hypothetical protein